MVRWGALLLLAGCTRRVSPLDVQDAMALHGWPASGSIVYLDNCQRCHEDDGRGVQRADLTRVVPRSTDEELVHAILAGPFTMPSFRRLPPQDIADVVTYLRREFSPPTPQPPAVSSR